MALDELGALLNAAPEKKQRGAVGAASAMRIGKGAIDQAADLYEQQRRMCDGFAAYYKVSLTDIVVLYDDIDLPAGVIRVRGKGGAGTHNGMRSILSHLGEGGFPRVRLGVGAPPEKWELIDFVLGVPKGEDALLFQRSIEHGAQAAKLLLTEGVEAAQRAYNGV